MPAKRIEDIKRSISPGLHVYLAYFNLLYFFEILYFMVLLFLIGGKYLSLAFGFASALLLSWHIIMLYFKKPGHRKIQLYLMDVHFAVSAAALIRMLLWHTNSTAIFMSFIFIRVLITLAEPFLIYMLTDGETAAEFSA
jgi:hypothetical protein